MNDKRRKFPPAPGLTGFPRQHPPRQTRLSRSLRPTPHTPSAGKVDCAPSLSDFKTPTRIPGPRAAGGFSGDSPHNDSDFQQDIIWDPTSPSPNRLGKRGKKPRGGVVDISEIVSRIAPKHGRPEAAEPTLQRWIGDSATIPCTPDVQVPKPKKKSPRLNGVDDLLKLAKRFDFNMFHQDEDEEQRSVELLTDDLFGLETCDPDAAAGTGVRPDPHAEDDLDFLFDGPTQTLSGGLSQGSSQLKPSSSHGSCSAATNITAPGALANDAFEDDWDDDLLNDSLVLEMTQNPQVFTAPKYCSTQKPAGPEPDPVRGGGVRGPSAAVKDKTRQSFRLESNPNFSLTRMQTDSWTNGSTQQSRVSPGQGSQWTWQTLNSVKPELQKPAFSQKTAFQSNMAAPAASNKSLKAPADLQDDDLLSVFSSDPVWDDPADDDLLCEVCEDLEKIQDLEMVSTKQTAGNQRAALQPANRNLLPCGGSSLAGGSGSSVSAVVRTGRVQGNQFSFKKPSNPVSMVTSKEVGKCSAAEIELKKQQAVERRRRRLQDAQNLRAPT